MLYFQEILLSLIKCGTNLLQIWSVHVVEFVPCIITVRQGILVADLNAGILRLYTYYITMIFAHCFSDTDELTSLFNPSDQVSQYFNVCHPKIER